MAYLDSDLDAEKREKRRWRNPKESTPGQKKRMLAKTMETAVRTVMKNHLYRFDGQVFKQTSGGPIGLELTQVLARLVMLWWDEQV